MNLKYKWYLRQDILGSMLSLFSATFIVMFLMIVRYAEFINNGLSMYEGVQFPKGFTMVDALHYFDKTSMEPLYFIALPIALVVDHFVVWPLVRKLRD